MNKPDDFMAGVGEIEIHATTTELADCILSERGFMIGPEDIPELIKWLKKADRYFREKQHAHI